MNRFWEKVKKTKSCWNWNASRHIFGYGFFSLKGKLMGAHRASWIIHNGKIPAGKCVLHKCDNPSCIRPDHLFLGTLADNVRDMDKKKRRGFHVGEKRPHKLTEKKIKRIKILSRKYSQYRLSAKFKVNQSTISRILNGKRWAHLNLGDL